MSSTIKPKSGTTAQWQDSGRVLEINEWGVEQTDRGSYILRIGDGKHIFHELPAVFNADTFEDAMAQVETATEAANSATVNANNARDTALTAAQSALTAANTASIAAQANTNAIVEEVSGDIITVSDSSNLALVGLKLYGKTTQVTTNGHQLFDASKVATKTAGGCTVTNNGDGSLTISGSGTLSETFSLSHDYTHEESVALLQEGTLHLAVGATTPQVMVYLVRNSGTQVLDNSNTTVEITQEMLTDTAFFLRLSVYGASGNTIKTGTVKPMLYQNGDGTFEPYTGGKPSPSPEYPQELLDIGHSGKINAYLYGKNLANVTSASVRGDSAIESNNGSIRIYSKKAGTYQGIVLPSRRMIAGRTYVLSLNVDTIVAGTLSFGLRDEGNTFISRKQITSTGRYSISYTPKSDIIASASVLITYSESTIGDATFSEIQMEVSNSVTQYEPYYNMQTLTYQTTNGLPGIPVTSGGNYIDTNGQQWICDDVDFARGVYVQRVGRIESCAGEEISSVFLSTTGELSDGATVLYALPASIETPLSAEEIAAFKALHSNKPNTTVYNDSGAHMEMDYIADTKSYIDNKFTALQQAILSAGANV